MDSVLPFKLLALFAVPLITLLNVIVLVNDCVFVQVYWAAALTPDIVDQYKLPAPLVVSTWPADPCVPVASIILIPLLKTRLAAYVVLPEK